MAVLGLDHVQIAAPPGCEGLTFLPYLSGERTPHADPHARGAFVGLTSHHGRGHLTRAVLEGVIGPMKRFRVVRGPTLGETGAVNRFR